MKCRIMNEEVDAPQPGYAVMAARGIFRARVLNVGVNTTNYSHSWELRSRTEPSHLTYGSGASASFKQACYEVTELAEKIAREMKHLARDLEYGL